MKNLKISEEILNEEEFCHYSGLPSPMAYQVEEMEFETFLELASVEVIEKFNNEYTKYSDGDQSDDKFFYANCTYWESKVK